MNKQKKLLKLQKRLKRKTNRVTRWHEKDVKRKTATWKISLKTDNGDVNRTATHKWLSSYGLKGETESFILAALDEATWKSQAKILKNGADTRCRLCTHSEETIKLMISGCPTIVNTEYLQIYTLGTMKALWDTTQREMIRVYTGTSSRRERYKHIMGFHCSQVQINRCKRTRCNNQKLWRTNLHHDKRGSTFSLIKAFHWKSYKKSQNENTLKLKWLKCGNSRQRLFQW